MSDKRRRFRKNKEDKFAITLAKRDEVLQQESQPKILLKTKAQEVLKNVSVSKHIIANRVDPFQSTKSSPIQNIKKDEEECYEQHLIESVPKMTRPVALISPSGAANTNASKSLIKDNKDFMVVGIIGTRGSGKSTILNILANEYQECDYYEKIFMDPNNIFPTKIKQSKFLARPRTESINMAITRNRVILLDSPPVLCNSYKKDMLMNNLDDLKSVTTFLSLCHLLIIVWDDYFNMNFIRLLHFAELMKATKEQQLLADYFPNILFVKNKAKREDFSGNTKQRMDQMIKTFFEGSQFCIFRGQIIDSQKQKKSYKHFGNSMVNTFILPEIKAANRLFLEDIIEDFRYTVFMSPRNNMVTKSTELTEGLWFELFLKTFQNKVNFFFDTYENVYKKHFDLTGINNGAVNAENDSNDTFENWRS